MKDVKLLVSSVLIIISFFIWMFFWRQINQDKIEKVKDEKKYINIDIKKSKINIDNQDENIFISINWKPLDEANLEIENMCN